MIALWPFSSKQTNFTFLFDILFMNALDEIVQNFSVIACSILVRKKNYPVT